MSHKWRFSLDWKCQSQSHADWSKGGRTKFWVLMFNHLAMTSIWVSFKHTKITQSMEITMLHQTCPFWDVLWFLRMGQLSKPLPKIFVIMLIPFSSLDSHYLVFARSHSINKSIFSTYVLSKKKTWRIVR